MVTSSKSVWCTWRQSTSDCLPLLWPLESAFDSRHSDAVPIKVTLLTLNSVLCTLAAWLEFLAALTILYVTPLLLSTLSMSRRAWTVDSGAREV